ncbi:MAG: oligosaccharide flippase family protein [Candidatus Hydrogenedentota bacterium]
MSVKQTIARNTLYNGLGRFWDAAVGLVLVAYIVFRLGTEGYGLWGVVAAFTGYVALLDVGFGSGYAKYVAEYAAKDQREKISEVVTTGLLFYLSFGVVFVAILWPLSGVLLDGLAQFYSDTNGSWSDTERQEEIRFLVQWSIVLFAVGNCAAPFTAVQSGLQRMGATNGIGAALTFVKAGATVYYLEQGFGVRGLLYTQAWVMGIFLVATCVAAFRVCPGSRVAPRFLSRDMMGRLFSFGWRTQVSRLSNLIMFQMDILVIAFLLNDLRLAGLYQIGVELANKMRQVPAIMWSALVPAVSELNARDDRDRIERLYLRSTKYVALIVMPMAAFLAGAAALAIPVWQGFDGDWVISVTVLQLMVFGYVANLLPGPGVTLALGMGRPDVQMRAGLISLCANLALTLILVYTIGFWGVPIATVVSMYVSWFWFMGAMRGVVDVEPSRLWRESIRGAVIASIPVGLFAWGVTFVSVSVGSRVEGLLGLAVMGAFCVAMYLAGLRRSTIFEEDDLDFMDHTLRLKHVPGYKAWSRSLRDEQ